MNAEVKQQLGVDVDNSWQLFNGDLLLVEGEDNLYQAISNRITCILDDMSIFYDSYGSTMREYIGEVNFVDNHTRMENEILLRLTDEPRISNAEVTVTGVTSNEVYINIHAIIDEYHDFDGNFVLDAYGGATEYKSKRVTQINFGVNNYINPEGEMYQVRRGDTVTMRCFVYDANKINSLMPCFNKTNGNLSDDILAGVPQGIVIFSYNKIPVYQCNLADDNEVVHETYHTDDDKHWGHADWTWTCPEDLPLGKYTFEARYIGCGKYSSCKTYTTFMVVDKYDTTTVIDDPKTYVTVGEKARVPTHVYDIHKGLVSEGEVYYYIGMGHNKMGTALEILDYYLSKEKSSITGESFLSSNVLYANASLKDSFGDGLLCGRVNFYIGNSEGFMKATQTTLEDAYLLKHENRTWLHVDVYSGYTPVDEGYLDWYYRKMSNIKTTLVLPDITEVGYGQKNSFYADVVDEDGYPVFDGSVTWYFGRGTKCLPYPSFIDAEPAWSANQNVFLNSFVYDENDFPITGGEVDWFINDGTYNWLLTETKTVLRNTYIEAGKYLGYFDASVTTAFNEAITGGHVEWYYNKVEGLVNTRITLPTNTKVYTGIDNVFKSKIVDEEGYNVMMGEVDYSIGYKYNIPEFDIYDYTYSNSIRNPSQIFTDKTNNTTNVTNLYYKNNITITELTREPLHRIHENQTQTTGICYDMTGAPIDFVTDNDIENLNENQTYGAMITTKDGEVIDMGYIVKQKDENGNIVSSYVSDNDVEDPEVQFKLE